MSKNVSGQTDGTHTLKNRFSVVDLIIDILLLTTTFVVPIDMSGLALLAGGFIQNLAHIGLLFLGYFGFALYVGRMYYANAVRTDRKWSPRPVFPTVSRILFPTPPLILFTWLVVINILFSAYNVFQIMTLPVFTSLLLILEALGFGFSFGLDFAIERHRATHPRDSIPSDNFFSESLPSYLPYLLLTVVIVFPADHFTNEFQAPPLAGIIIVGASCIITYFLGRRMEKGLFSKLKIESTMNVATVVVVSILMVVGFIGLDVLEVLARTHVAILGTSTAAGLFILFLFGVVPIRIGSIFFSKTTFFNKVLGAVALISYLAVQSGLIVIGWKL